MTGSVQHYNRAATPAGEATVIVVFARLRCNASIGRISGPITNPYAADGVRRTFPGGRVLGAIAAACSWSDADASWAFWEVDDNKWNQRRMTRVAKSHHKNHVFSMKAIKELLPGSWWRHQESRIPNPVLEYTRLSIGILDIDGVATRPRFTVTFVMTACDPDHRWFRESVAE